MQVSDSSSLLLRTLLLRLNTRARCLSRYWDIGFGDALKRVAEQATHETEESTDEDDDRYESTGDASHASDACEDGDAAPCAHPKENTDWDEPRHEAGEEADERRSPEALDEEAANCGSEQTAGPPQEVEQRQCKHDDEDEGLQYVAVSKEC